MGKKYNKNEIDMELIKSIHQLECEWKQIQSMMKRSIEPMEGGYILESLAQAKYVFLLKEARYRKLRAFH
ncbi:DUF2508 family protein [Oceanobacillus senegalensis]|uniref:DUF2508 family protein n=1 Tax=Oceanobacillus senegalensis TaxID=1936063 RepID=UPI000A30A404|nr:DUF2508 family protein [Oceanobacillus senegalensis]